jgi:hypothetical protein
MSKARRFEARHVDPSRFPRDASPRPCRGRPAEAARLPAAGAGRRRTSGAGGEALVLPPSSSLEYSLGNRAGAMRRGHQLRRLRSGGLKSVGSGRHHTRALQGQPDKRLFGTPLLAGRGCVPKWNSSPAAKAPPADGRSPLHAQRAGPLLPEQSPRSASAGHQPKPRTARRFHLLERHGKVSHDFEGHA